MAMMKEYMEVLTSEMEAFRSDVKKLEDINHNLDKVEVSINIKELRVLLDGHKSQLERQSEQQERFYTRMETLFQRAGIYPKWAVITSILAIFFSAASLIYAHQIKVSSKKASETISIESTAIKE